MCGRITSFAAKYFVTEIELPKPAPAVSVVPSLFAAVIDTILVVNCELFSERPIVLALEKLALKLIEYLPGVLIAILKPFVALFETVSAAAVSTFSTTVVKYGMRVLVDP